MRIEGEPEPVINEIKEILGSKHEDQFSDHSFDLVHNTFLVRF